MGKSAVTVLHNFETGHRLPHLGGKCRNLHGHSWWGEITVTAPLDADGTVVEFGALKAAIRGWVDTHLDHGLMLGALDLLVPAVQADGSKLFRFGAADPTEAEKLAADLAWPTVENVAVLLARVAGQQLATFADDVSRLGEVTNVIVRETHVNRAEWSNRR